VSSIRVVVALSYCLLCVLVGIAFPQQPDRFESLLASAQDAQTRSDFQAAAKFYSEAVALHPEIPELRANLGLMYYQLGNAEQAREVFRQTLRLKPGLFVPELFLGLGYVKEKRFNEAVPYLKQAVFSQPGDARAALALGQAYTGLGKSRLAISTYRHLIEHNPQDADGWFHLGVSYLEQVEDDARVLLAKHKGSGYLHALIANSFAEQKAYVQATEAYKKALQSPTYPPGTHAAYGFVLLHQHELSSAERELNIELASHPGSLIAKLGMAGLHVEQGAADKGARELAGIWNADVAFLRVNAPMFVAGLSASRLLQLQEALKNGKANGNIPEAVISLFEKGSALSRAVQKPKATGSVDKPTWPLNQSAATLHASGKYRECTDLLVAQFHSLQVRQVSLLADCAYSSAAFQVTFTAAEKLVLNQATEAEGLYWEIRSVQKLAGEALDHASELNSDSPMLHVLLGDIYRQRKYWPDAQNEYRKALALKPEDGGALFGLSLALLADGKTDLARELSEASLRKSPDDPEFNAVMGEILSAQHDFSGAEPYLKKALNTKPELVPHVHALLGRVYSETGRTEQAIAEFRMGLADDKDGRIHFQLGRVYLKLGDRESAQKAFEVSERLRREGLTRAEVAMQQGENSDESQ
jgi:tetratricopeptide (TPR) repeat protein